MEGHVKLKILTSAFENVVFYLRIAKSYKPTFVCVLFLMRCLNAS